MSRQTITELLVEIGVDVEDAKKAEGKVDSLRKSTTKMGDAADKATKGAAAGFRRLGRRMDAMVAKGGASLKKLIDRMGGLKTIAIAAGAAIGAAAVGVFKFVDSQTAAIDETNKLSASLGMGVEELQRLQFAAGQSGVSSERFNVAMKKLNQSMLDIASGAGGRAKEAFDELGISLDQLEGKSHTEQIGFIGDALNGISNEAERSAQAARIFGEEAGPALASMLASGSRGLKELASQAQGVLTQEDADRASAFQDRMGELRMELTAVGRSIATHLLPFVEHVIVAIRNWVAENGQLIRQDLPRFINSVSRGMRQLWADTKAVWMITSELTTLVGQSISMWNQLAGSVDGVGLKMDFLVQRLGAMAGPMVDIMNMARAASAALFELGLAQRSLDEGADLQAFSESVTSQVNAIRQNAMAAAGPQQFDTMKRGSNVMAGAAAPPAPAGGGGGGAPSAPSAPSAPAQPDVPEGITVEQVLRRFQAGQMGVLQERLRGLSASTPSVRDVKPTTAITMVEFKNEQTITSTDPVGAGRESARAIKQIISTEFARAAQMVGSNVRR